MADGYFEIISLVARLNWSFPQLVQLELNRIGITEINAMECMRLFNMGDAEMTIAGLKLRGCNASYTVREMVENGYLMRERSAHDRRSVHVRLTDKGLARSA